MAGSLGVDWAVAWTRRTAQVVADHRSELIELDRQIGDGDHGENLTRGFSAVIQRLDALEEPPAEVGDVLKLVATTLMSTVGVWPSAMPTALNTNTPLPVVRARADRPVCRCSACRRRLTASYG